MVSIAFVWSWLDAPSADCCCLAGRSPAPTSITKGFLATKDKKLSIRISEDDLAAIHRKADQSGMSLTEYVTVSCLGRQITIINDLDNVLKEQKAIGRNLNQLTLLCNMRATSKDYAPRRTSCA